MRKMVLDIEPFEGVKWADSETFRHIEYYRVLEVVKLDYSEGLYVDLIECKLKKNAPVQNLKSIGNMEILSVVKSEGDTLVCLVKGRDSTNETAMLSRADLNLIYTTPSMLSENRIVVSFLGTERDLSTFVKLVKAHVGRIKGLSLKKAVVGKKDVLSALTAKQKEVLVAAHRNGYYDIPRKISSRRLSKKVGLSKPTLLEHLRKAEMRMVGEILESALEGAPA